MSVYDQIDMSALQSHHSDRYVFSSIEVANAWLNTFIADFNPRFARPAKYPKDLYRPVAQSNEDPDDIFAW